MDSRARRVVQSVALTATLGPGVADARPLETPPAARTVLERLNHERRTAGIPSLRYSHDLTVSATRFSKRQLATGRFGHGSSIHAPRSFRRLGEVLALQRGWRLRAGAVVNGWERSSTHRSVVASAAFAYVGIGWAHGWLGGRPTTIWTAQFGGR